MSVCYSWRYSLIFRLAPSPAILCLQPLSPRIRHLLLTNSLSFPSTSPITPFLAQYCQPSTPLSFISTHTSPTFNFPQPPHLLIFRSSLSSTLTPHLPLHFFFQLTFLSSLFSNQFILVPRSTLNSLFINFPHP